MIGSFRGVMVKWRIVVWYYALSMVNSSCKVLVKYKSIGTHGADLVNVKNIKYVMLERVKRNF